MASVTARWCLAFALLMSLAACAQNPPAAGATSGAHDAAATRVRPNEAATTGRALFHEAVGVLSTRALGRERVDWAVVESELRPTIPESGAPPTAYAAIQAAVDRLGDPHARFNAARVPAASTNTTSAPQAANQNHQEEKADGAERPSQPAPQPPPRPRIPTVPEGQILADGSAYLVVPGCMAPDVDGLRAYARAGAAEIARLNAAGPSGWVIDLRLNGGGNLWPMLLGLHALLGDGPRMATVDSGGVASRYGVSEGQGSWIDWGSGPETQLNWGDAPPSNPAIVRRGRVAVLLGSWTMSSGEALAICFASTHDTRWFGEASAGLTTATNFFPLSDGSMLNLPVAYMATLSGVPYSGKLAPDEPVAFGDWPLPDDAAAVAARRWVVVK